MSFLKAADPIAAKENSLKRFREELLEFEVAAEQHRAAAIKLDMEGGDATSIEAAMRVAQDRAKTKTGSITSVENELAALIAARDKQLDEKTRNATLDEIKGKVRESFDIERDGEAFFARLEAFTAWAQPFAPEAQGLVNYSRVSAQQVPEAMALV